MQPLHLGSTKSVIHKEAIDIHTLPKQCEDIALTMQSEERQVNRRMLYFIIRSIKYLLGKARHSGVIAVMKGILFGY